MNQSLRINSVITLMFKYNLKWHVTVMKDILLRYKILFVFAVALAAPSFKTLLYVIKFPAINLLAISPVKNHFLYSLLAFQLLAIVWVAINHAVIGKQSWNKYINALPISSRQRLIIDSGLLLFFNWILWLPLFVAGIGFLSETQNNIHLLILAATKVCLNILLVLLTQIFWMKGSRWLLGIVFLIDLLLIQFSTVNASGQLMVSSFFIGLIIFMIIFFYQRLNFQPESVRGFIKLDTCRIKKCHEWTVSMQIQLAHLLDHIEQLSVWLIAFSASFSLALLFIIYDKDQSSLIFILTLAIFFNALLSSHLFKRLDLQRNTFVAFLSSLPTTKLKVFMIDYVMVFSIMLILNSSILFLALCFSPVIMSSMTFPLILSAIFLVLSYYPQVKMDRFGSFISLLVMMVLIAVNHSLKRII